MSLCRKTLSPMYFVPSVQSMGVFSLASFISVVGVCNSVIWSMFCWIKKKEQTNNIQSLQSKKKKHAQKHKTPNSKNKAIQSNATFRVWVTAAWRICHFSQNLVVVFILQCSKCSAVFDQKKMLSLKSRPVAAFCLGSWHSWFLHFALCQISSMQIFFFPARLMQQVYMKHVYLWWLTAGCTSVLS